MHPPYGSLDFMHELVHNQSTTIHMEGHIMLLSGKIAIAFGIIFIVTFFLAQIVGPSIGDMRSGSSSFDGIQRQASAASSLSKVAYISLLVGVTSGIICGFQKLMNKDTGPRVIIGGVEGPVQVGNNSATGSSQVAGPGATISGTIKRTSTKSTIQTEIQNSLRSVKAVCV